MLKKRALALFFVSSLVVALIGTAAAGDGEKGDRGIKF